MHTHSLILRVSSISISLLGSLLAVDSARADEQTANPPADPDAPVVVDPSTAHQHARPETHEHEGHDDEAGHHHDDDGHHHHDDDAKADADDPDEVEVLVTGTNKPTSASSITVSGGELKLRPRLRPADILEVAPGLITVQHSGGGKANQYFLRGFDIDHGTDLLLRVDGVPVNMVSHGHGQGYADLNFLIPELVSSVDVRKGPYYAEYGDFATAGAIDMNLADHVHESQVAFTIGQYGIRRGLGIVSREVGNDWRFLIAGEAYMQDGPFENKEDLTRFNLTTRVTHDLSDSSSVTIGWMSYSGRWNASGQIPLREVEAGRLDRFGTLDPTEGGETQRHSGSVRFVTQLEDADLEVVAYGTHYNWSLFSNFTFFLNDPDNGDMIEQTDERTTLGLEARTRFHHHFGPLRLETAIGTQLRADIIDNALYHDVRRERLDTTADAHINQSGIGVFVDEQARLLDIITVQAGVRLDRADVAVEDNLDDPTTLGDRQGGSDGATLISPKASVTLSPRPWLDFFVNFGRGFHSNDARGAVRSAAANSGDVNPNAANLLVPATGYEVGVRGNPWKPLTISVAAYRLDLDSEQVYVGDEGTTEPSDATSRRGIETSARLYFGRWLFADAAATFNEAIYRGNAGNAGSIALAPTRTITGGIAFRAPWGTFGSLRLRHIGARPATEDERLTAEGWTIFDARLGQRLGPAELTLDAQNLFNSDWREVQFATTSRLQNDPSPSEQIHFAPGWPFTFRATLAAYF